jgi:CRISPR/Cas system CMR-associated protein Cmr5 small subunit
MNERIQELAEQAKEYAFKAMVEIKDLEKALEVYLESYDTKFAQLIIEECCDVVRYIDAVDIKKHFGVES